jgi:hypothetical protein
MRDPRKVNTFVGKSIRIYFFIKKERGVTVRLVPVIVCLYLTLIHATSVFSIPLAHQRYSSMLQHPGYSPSVSAFSLTVSTTILDLIIFEFIF